MKLKKIRRKDLLPGDEYCINDGQHNNSVFMLTKSGESKDQLAVCVQTGFGMSAGTIMYICFNDNDYLWKVIR